MNIVRKDLDQNNAIITLSVEKADYNEKVEKTLRQYRQKANIPGFRPGMVPLGLLKKMYGKAILAEELNKIVGEELQKYLQESKVDILGEPLVNETEQEPVNFDTDRENFEFKFDIGIAPEFDVTFSGKDKVKYYNIAVSDEMIENQVKSYTGRYGKYVQEESVELNDMVKGSLLELNDGKVNESGIKLNDAVLTPAYIKVESKKAEFAGAKIGDMITFNPSAAFENDAELASFLKISKEEAAGIKSDFQFTITGITRYHESPVDQELFDKVYGEGVVTSEDEFKAKIRENIQENLTGDSNYKFGLDARDMLLAKFTDLSFPDAFLKRWVIETNKNISAETLEEEYPKMIEGLKWQLIKNKIAKANEIKIENEDIEQYAKTVTKAQFAQYGMVGVEEDIINNYAKDMLKKEDNLKGIIEKVEENKVMEVVKANVKLDMVAISVEDFNKMFES